MLTKAIDAGGILRTITPSNTEFVNNCKAVRVDAAGTLVLRWGSAADVTLNVTAGEVLPLSSPFQVRTATTATVHGFFDR